jgi:hypothetical protein
VRVIDKAGKVFAGNLNNKEQLPHVELDGWFIPKVTINFDKLIPLTGVKK